MSKTFSRELKADRAREFLRSASAPHDPLAPLIAAPMEAPPLPPPPAPPVPPVEAVEPEPLAAPRPPQPQPEPGGVHMTPDPRYDVLSRMHVGCAGTRYAVSGRAWLVGIGSFALTGWLVVAGADLARQARVEDIAQTTQGFIHATAHAAAKAVAAAEEAARSKVPPVSEGQEFALLVDAEHDKIERLLEEHAAQVPAEPEEPQAVVAPAAPAPITSTPPIIVAPPKRIELPAPVMAPPAPSQQMVAVSLRRFRKPVDTDSDSLGSERKKLPPLFRASQF
jgi:hypothetical protein